MADQDAADARLYDSDEEVRRLVKRRYEARWGLRDLKNLKKAALAQIASGDFNPQAINPATLEENRVATARAQADADRATADLRKRGFQG